MSGKQPSPRTLLDEQKVLDKLGRLQDPLEKLSSIIDPKLFSPGLNELLTKEPKGKGGPPCLGLCVDVQDADFAALLQHQG